MNLTTEKPILFNTEMVKAILQGRKTSTRRIIKGNIPNDATWGYTFFTPKNHVSFRGTFGGQYGEKFFKPPYWIEDILYVRETWQEWTDDMCTCYECHGCNHGDYIYKAGYGDDEGIKWRPSIHMPKKAARIFLKVTDIKAQQIQNITEDEAKEEGIKSYTKDEKVYKYAVNDDWWMDYCNKHKKVGTWWQQMPTTAKEAFKYLWSSCGYKWPKCWDANPWVWVIKFEICENGGIVKCQENTDVHGQI